MIPVGAAGVGRPGTAVDGPGDPADSQGDAEHRLSKLSTGPAAVRADVVIRRTGPTTVAYDLEITAAARVESLVVAVGPDGTVVRSEGFENRSGGPTVAPYELSSDGTATLVIEHDLRAAGSAGNHVLVADDWLLTRVPYLGLSWTTRENDTVRRSQLLIDRGNLSPRVDRTVRTVGEGFLRNRYLYLGSYTRYRSAEPAGNGTAGRRCVAYVPAVASIRPEKPCAAVREATATFAGNGLESQPSTRPVTAVVAPTPDPEVRGELLVETRWEKRGQATAATGFVVSDSAPASVWVHEYVHTEQAFETSSEAVWLSEAIAEYYEYTLGYRAGVLDRGQFERHFRSNTDGDSVLASRSNWTSRYAPYRKGSRLVAYLDYRIRTLTDGNRSFCDVLIRLNGHEGSVTIGVLVDTVQAVSGSEALARETEMYARSATRIRTGRAVEELAALNGGEHRSTDGRTAELTHSAGQRETSTTESYARLYRYLIRFR